MRNASAVAHARDNNPIQCHKCGQPLTLVLQRSTWTPPGTNWEWDQKTGKFKPFDDDSKSELHPDEFVEFLCGNCQTELTSDEYKYWEAHKGE